jgi:DNA-directed RNA polymerase subunit M/transcription elongation factor TFIIS
MDRAVAFLVAQGNLALVLSPLCLQCGHMMGQYAHANDIPDEVACEECGQGYHISELDIRVAYEVVKAPTEESPGS